MSAGRTSCSQPPEHATYYTQNGLCNAASTGAHHLPSSSRRRHVLRMNRREFIAGNTVAGEDSYSPRSVFRAQAPAAIPRRIDVHHHLISPAWKCTDEQMDGLGKYLQGYETAIAYDPAKDIEQMDMGGVEKSYFSSHAGMCLVISTKPGGLCVSRTNMERSWSSSTKAGLGISPPCPCRMSTRLCAKSSMPSIL